MLTKRREDILRSLIQEYITTAVPVSSEIVARKSGLGVSSATVRAEMSHLEESGYIVQPHTSAGRIPSTKGYRYYVESIIQEPTLNLHDQLQIRHQFYQADKEIEQWMHLTASILSRMLANVAIITMPRVIDPRLKLVKLISLRDPVALLIVIFQSASFRQHVLVFDEAMSQEELNRMATMLTDKYGDLSFSEIVETEEQLSGIEKQVAKSVTELMREEENKSTGEMYYDGLSQILNQPEFNKGDKAKALMELLEERNVMNTILSQAPQGPYLQVIIGGESEDSMLHDFSVVMGQYGLAGQTDGIIGVVGPTRMAYEKVFSSVRFLSTIMNELVQDIYE